MFAQLSTRLKQVIRKLRSAVAVTTHQRAYMPWLEALEDRLTPAPEFFPVDLSLGAADRAIALDTAIRLANLDNDPRDVIGFVNAPVGQLNPTITITTALPSITAPYTINGHAISGYASGNALLVQTNPTQYVTLVYGGSKADANGLTITYNNPLMGHAVVV